MTHFCGILIFCIALKSESNKKVLRCLKCRLCLKWIAIRFILFEEKKSDSANLQIVFIILQMLKTWHKQYFYGSWNTHELNIGLCWRKNALVHATLKFYPVQLFSTWSICANDIFKFIRLSVYIVPLYYSREIVYSIYCHSQNVAILFSLRILRR